MKNKVVECRDRRTEKIFLVKSLWLMWTGGVVPIPVMFGVSVAVWLRRS